MFLLVSIVLTILYEPFASAESDVECVDSPLKLVFLPATMRRTCQYAVNIIGCEDPQWGQDISTHCPLTCTEETGFDYCASNKCLDSTATSIYSTPGATITYGTLNAEYKTCADFNTDDVSDAMRELICEQKPSFFATCRETCNYCGLSLESLGPSPSLSPSQINLDNVLFLDFDDADVYYFDPVDDYNYDIDIGWEYQSQDIFIEGLDWFDDTLSLGGVGFDHGIISEPNAAFNPDGLPVQFICLDGSFTIQSLYLNSALSDSCFVVFTGIKNDGSAVVETVTLTSMTEPELVEFDGFDDLNYLRMETPYDGDIFVIDNMYLLVQSECFVPEYTSESNPVLSKLETKRTIDTQDLWPIYPIGKSMLND